ncbi:hypothetical protein NliqN6_1498 [Naganishia liquefaciens]|uniref:Uncharacterized protein n=1 Tax=Naganishia liquefaciens TaxID=104408 RepID=A0A8H3TPR6_9TREE|nr:hypothetical protein NliqN6_1498 [Naganishia liquefaciens]
MPRGEATIVVLDRSHQSTPSTGYIRSLNVLDTHRATASSAALCLCVNKASGKKRTIPLEKDQVGKSNTINRHRKSPNYRQAILHEQHRN